MTKVSQNDRTTWLRGLLIRVHNSRRMETTSVPAPTCSLPRSRPAHSSELLIRCTVYRTVGAAAFVFFEPSKWAWHLNHRNHHVLDCSFARTRATISVETPPCRQLAGTIVSQFTGYKVIDEGIPERPGHMATQAANMRPQF